jgi:hypothetical protein
VVGNIDGVFVVAFKVFKFFRWVRRIGLVSNIEFVRVV